MGELLQFLYLTPVGVVKFDRAGIVDLINPAASALLLSLKPDDTLLDLYAVLFPVAPDLRDAVAQFAEPTGAVIDQRRLKTSVGETPVVLSLTVHRVNETAYMAVLQDVTRLAEQEHSLYANRQKFFAIFDHVRDYAIYTITLEGIIEEWNPSLQRYGGWLPDDVQGISMTRFFPSDDPARPHLPDLLAVALRVGSVETEGWRLKRDGSRLWVNTIITASPDETGAVRGFVVVSRDMTERKRLEDQMKLQATIDQLTSANNRRHGDALLDAEFSRRARDGRPFAALMLDIDHFKTINDSFGHAAGDEVLRTLVVVCRRALRAVDIVVRWGGEEFLLLLPGTDSAAALSAAERLCRELAATEIAVPEGGPIHFTVSIGVAVAADDTARSLLHRADVAMYAAKSGGRNRAVLAA